MLADSDLKNARILVADDQSAHVQLLERMLRDAGYVNVAATIDPQQVCPLHREHHYDLILLDLQMPVMDGFGVMKALQAVAVAGVLPVIALTAQPGHRLRALEAGARDFIDKPFDLVEVRIRIRHMLEVQLLYKMLEAQNQALEHAVRERTAALQESEARYRGLTELAADWHWEQDEAGEVTSGRCPVPEIMGRRNGAAGTAWDSAACQALQDKIAARQSFLDFVLHRPLADGSQQQIRISGEPRFDSYCRVTGYRGVATEVPTGNLATQAAGPSG
jgi:CheY-like chemotaxis protein